MPLDRNIESTDEPNLVLENETVSTGFAESQKLKLDPNPPYQILHLAKANEVEAFIESLPHNANWYMVGAGKLIGQQIDGVSSLPHPGLDGVVLLISCLTKDQLEEELENHGLLSRLRFPGAVSQMVWLFPKKKVQSLFSTLKAIVLLTDSGISEVLISQISEK